MRYVLVSRNLDHGCRFLELTSVCSARGSEVVEAAEEQTSCLTRQSSHAPAVESANADARVQTSALWVNVSEVIVGSDVLQQVK